MIALPTFFASAVMSGILAVGVVTAMRPPAPMVVARPAAPAVERWQLAVVRSGRVEVLRYVPAFDLCDTMARMHVEAVRQDPAHVPGTISITCALVGRGFTA